MINEVIKNARERMKKAIIATGHELAGVRTGRASASILDRINIDYYGTKTPINQAASISVPESQLLLIQPWDKSIIAEIEKAILNSDLGITPANDGQVIRLPFPPLSEERRKELVKIVKKYAEEGRVAVRNIRRDANEHLKKEEKNHEISEDDLARAEDEVQKLTDGKIKDIDDLLTMKEKEIMEV
ncbi:MAG TPA: ribosome recycling factor [Actinobacteria bacterium]|nr:ribosome recycling factor [Actinomycetes bacterium]HEX21792.1 ribosome recycling factor [Actinomycetota bacterium]